MTTIAATLAAIAGDRMVFDEGKGTWYPSVKVRRIKGALVGAAGDAGDCMRLMDWAEAGFPEKKRPKFEEPAGTEDSAILLLVNAEGIHMMAVSDPYPEPVAAGTYAIGSGGKAALAAMHCGKTIAEAMDVAAEIDPYTRAPFDILALKE